MTAYVAPWYAPLPAGLTAEYSVITPTTATTGDMSAAIPMTGLRFAASGSGNPQYYDGDIARHIILSKALSQLEVAGVYRWLNQQYGFSFS